MYKVYRERRRQEKPIEITVRLMIVTVRLITIVAVGLKDFSIFRFEMWR